MHRRRIPLRSAHLRGFLSFALKAQLGSRVDCLCRWIKASCKRKHALGCPEIRVQNADLAACKTLASPCRPGPTLRPQQGLAASSAPLQRCRQHSSVAAPSYCGKTAARSCEQRSYSTCCKLVVALLYAIRASAPLVHCVAATPPPRSCVDCIAATPPPRPSTKQPCGSAYCSRRSRACASRGALGFGRGPKRHLS